jgi:ABC-type multidrug transport system ATPase subunit
MRDLLRQLAGEGRTVLVSSHLLAEAAQKVQDVVVISHGRLAAEGPVADLTATGTTRIRTPDAELLMSALARQQITAQRVAADTVPGFRVPHREAQVRAVSTGSPRSRRMLRSRWRARWGSRAAGCCHRRW